MDQLARNLLVIGGLLTIFGIVIIIYLIQQRDKS